MTKQIVFSLCTNKITVPYFGFHEILRPNCTDNYIGYVHRGDTVSIKKKMGKKKKNLFLTLLIGGMAAVLYGSLRKYRNKLHDP